MLNKDTIKFSEIPYVRVDVEKLTQLIEKEIERFKTGDVESQVEALKVMNDGFEEAETMNALCYMRFTMNTKDAFYKEEVDALAEIEPEVLKLKTAMYSALVKADNREALEKELPPLLFAKGEFLMGTYSDSVKDELVKESKLMNEYADLMSNLEIEYEGNTYNLSQMTPFMNDKEREKRHAANDAAYNTLENNHDELDRIYDELVTVRTRIARRLGYDSFIELGYKRMERFDYTPEQVATYRELVRTYIVPLSSKLRQRQQKRLGVKELTYYDWTYFFETGNPTPKGNREWIVERGQKMYDELGKDIGDFFRMMQERQLLDLDTRKGKSGGGYCESLATYQTPFVFANFNRTAHDVEVLTHEIGHAFQSYSSNWIPFLDLKSPTMESAEIHSMSMEFLTHPWMGLFFEEDKDKFIYNHLASAINFIPYGVMVDEFQHEVYANPGMSPAERCALWADLESVYLPDKVNTGNAFLEKGGFWQRQGHIYEDPFYYIDYTLAQVVALQFYLRDQEDHDKAWEDYKTLCHLGGSKSFLQLLQEVGLESPFVEKSLKRISEVVESVLENIDDQKL